METKNLQTKTYVPELLPGIFTVNDSRKKIKFTRGNLFWNGSEFRCEEHAYDYPTAWDPKHVGHFYWSKTASVAYAKNYSDSGASDTDKFFAANGRVFEGFTVLNDDEWKRLFRNALAKNSSGKNTITINGVECIVLKPDGFTGTVKDSYTAEEWAIAEASGLKALPFAGYRYGASIYGTGSYGYLWSASPNDSDYAWHARFLNSDAYTVGRNRLNGYSVALVSVQ